MKVLKPNTIVQFINYSPKIYSGFDKFNILLAKKMKFKNIQSIFVFNDEVTLPDLISDLKKENISIELICTKNKIRILLDTLKIYRKYKPDIVHSHFDNYIQLLTAIISKIFSSQHYTSFHSMITPFNANEYSKKKGKFKHFLLSCYYKTLVSLSVKIFFVSNAIKEQFKQISNINSNKLNTLYLGVETENTPTKQPVQSDTYNKNTSTIILCNISAIEETKGIDILIHALYLVKSKYPNLNFKCYHIGGLRSNNSFNINYENKLKKLVHDLKLDENFIWLGQRNDILKQLESIDIYIHPSRNEGLGVSIMEACTMSKPIIATNIGGIPEIVHHESNGFLFKIDEVQELADYILILLNNETLRLKMGHESKQIVKKYFNIDIQTTILSKLYSGETS
jgi:glycosyltransferase involved in cell wall biosynthesis